MHRHTSLGVPSSLLQAQTESPGTLVAENHCFKAKRIVLPLVKLSQQWRSRPLLDKRYKDPATFFFSSFSAYWQIFSFHITNKPLFITVCLKAFLGLVVMNFVLCNLYFRLPSFPSDLLTTGTKHGGKAALVFFFLLLGRLADMWHWICPRVQSCLDLCACEVGSFREQILFSNWVIVRLHAPFPPPSQEMLLYAVR